MKRGRPHTSVWGRLRPAENAVRRPGGTESNLLLHAGSIDTDCPAITADA